MDFLPGWTRDNFTRRTAEMEPESALKRYRTIATCRGKPAEKEVRPMQYRVYSGPKGSGEISPIAKEQMLFKQFTTLDDALSWARHVEQGGRVPLLIEGDDGTRMDRRSIADALRVGQRGQVGRQPVQGR